MQNLIDYKKELAETIKQKFDKDGILDYAIIEEFGRVSSELYLIEQFKMVT